VAERVIDTFAVHLTFDSREESALAVPSYGLVLRRLRHTGLIEKWQGREKRHAMAFKLTSRSAASIAYADHELRRLCEAEFFQTDGVRVYVCPQLSLGGLFSGCDKIAHLIGGAFGFRDGIGHVSSMLVGNAEGFSKRGEFVLGGLPQSSSCAPQGKSEESHRQRSQGGNSFTVLAGCSAGTSGVQLQPSERDAEQATFFIKGVIGMLVLLVVYTILKRR
jgi:hypothetical protein